MVLFRRPTRFGDRSELLGLVEEFIDSGGVGKLHVVYEFQPVDRLVGFIVHGAQLGDELIARWARGRPVVCSDRSGRVQQLIGGPSPIADSAIGIPRQITN